MEKKYIASNIVPWLWKGTLPAFSSVLLLNSPQCTPSFLPAIWNESALRSCADGAANRLLSFEAKETLLPPHVILGDLDSALPEVLRHYEGLGTCIVRMVDQDRTDFEKLLAYPAVEDRLLHGDGPTAVLGGLGGFVSHELANIRVAHGGHDLVLLGENAVAVVLGKGRSTWVDMDTQGSSVSLVPFLGLTENVSTSGLKWNLNDDALHFGGLVSTSNRAVSGTVTINTPRPLLMLIEKRD
jgi:thiamine pyrophosphokinase